MATNITKKRHSDTMSLLGKVHTIGYEAFLQTTKKSRQDSRSNYKLRENTGGQRNILN